MCIRQEAYTHKNVIPMVWFGLVQFEEKKTIRQSVRSRLFSKLKNN